MTQEATGMTPVMTGATGGISHDACDPALLRSAVIDAVLRVFEDTTPHILREPNRMGRPQISNPDAAARYAADILCSREQERLVAIPLDSQNQPLALPLIYQGTVDCVLARMADCFREAVRVNATSIVFLHNHPSGNARESIEDIRMTRAMERAGKLLGIIVLDHIIVAGPILASGCPEHVRSLRQCADMEPIESYRPQEGDES